MKRTSLVLILAALALAGCLSKVPRDQRAGDPWRERAIATSGPTTIN